MRLIHLFILAIVILLFSSNFLSMPAHAAGKMQVAVLDLQPKGVSKVIAGAVTDIIRSEMVDGGLHRGGARPDERDPKEQGFQMTGCTDRPAPCRWESSSRRRRS